MAARTLDEDTVRRRSWKKHMRELPREWSRLAWYKDLDRIAKAEGWALFTADTPEGLLIQIQAIDDPEAEDGEGRLPGGDGEAYDLVARRAVEGSGLHALALYLDGRTAGRGKITVPCRLLVQQRPVKLATEADPARTVLLPPVTPDELNTILAALRYYQENGQGDPENRSADIQEIACPDGGENTSLDDGIDELCEYINCDSRRMPEDN